MENRFKRIFLILLILAIGPMAWAQETTEDTPREETVLNDVINPNVKRRRIREDKIDKENFETGIFYGVMSVEDFGTNPIYGARFGYHLTEDWFVEAVGGVTDTSPSVDEEAEPGFQRLTDAQRELIYWNLSLGFNLFPGEVFVGRKWAFNTSYYLILGAGATDFAGNEYFTYNFGGGYRMFLTDWFALRVDFRNHIFTHSIFGDNKRIQNLESHFGFTFFF